MLKKCGFLLYFYLSTVCSSRKENNIFKDLQYESDGWHGYPEENRDVTNVELIEGDILLSKQKRNAVADKTKVWSSRTVPYVIDSAIVDPMLSQISGAMSDIQSATCVTFKARDSEADYIHIKMLDGCWSAIGRQGGMQEISLDSDCQDKGTIIHELLHSLGFFHEHSRTDRDNYVDIFIDNVQDGYKHNFDKYSKEIIDDLGANYDYDSVMHYKKDMFARASNLNTILPKDRTISIGQRVGLSSIDVYKINALYSCDIVSCLDPGTPANGARTGEDFRVGQSVSYSCNTGYTLVFSSTRVCENTGRWSGSTAQCVSGTFHYCNLDSSDLCGWTQDPSADIPWSWNSGTTVTSDTGPDNDNTLETSSGYYLYLEASTPVVEGMRAVLISPVFQPSIPTGATCLKFFYHRYGADMGAMNVILRESGKSDVNLLQLVGQTGRTWHEEIIALSVTNNFQIEFEGIRGVDYLSDMAIDDLMVGECTALQNVQSPVFFKDQGPMLVSHTCNFDSGLCSDWLQEGNEEFDWTNQLGSTPTSKTGPDCDRLNCTYGRYMFIESSSPRILGDAARLITPVFQPATKCASWYYHMYGRDIGQLNVYLRSNGTDSLLWNLSGEIANSWLKSESMEIVSNTKFMLVFECVRGMDYEGDIAIDDFNMVDGACVPTTSEPEPGLSSMDCNFDNGMCEWVNDVLDDFDWTRLSGPTPTSNTGPSADHTTGSGYYMYTESSEPVLEGQRARIMGPLMPSIDVLSNYCFEFFYHMYGSSIGTLRVVFLGLTGKPETTIWEVTGNQGNAWYKAQVPITDTKTEFQIAFDGVMGSYYYSDIAIDDITFFQGPCDTVSNNISH